MRMTTIATAFLILIGASIYAPQTYAGRQLDEVGEKINQLVQQALTQRDESQLETSIFFAELRKTYPDLKDDAIYQRLHRMGRLSLPAKYKEVLI